MSKHTSPSSNLFPSFALFPNEFSLHSDSKEKGEFPVEITDEFIDPLGRWVNYDSIPSVQEEQLKVQEHVDIRSFVPDKPAAEVTMFMMDRLTMFSLDKSELGLYSHDSIPSAKVVVIDNEGWTFGSVGPQSDRNNWNGISFECIANQTTTTQSVIMIKS